MRAVTGVPQAMHSRTRADNILPKYNLVLGSVGNHLPARKGFFQLEFYQRHRLNNESRVLLSMPILLLPNSFCKYYWENCLNVLSCALHLLAIMKPLSIPIRKPHKLV